MPHQVQARGKGNVSSRLADANAGLSFRRNWRVDCLSGSLLLVPRCRLIPAAEIKYLEQAPLPLQGWCGGRAGRKAGPVCMSSVVWGRKVVLR
ncbi:hypothetical protein N7447_008550 [Penicillium robsamsonii]|uniref:uncharacterized protein n=1 Tax=Penicillium robsamsonii TaxID=1792511 RepID=UPI002546DBA4|nr:uncharacterized protein N7447_008550 [Penicillium robsamsonii]KAJ5816317.1 hypothetical protein N7447_008550 [Penicillium robsamsonii]